MDEKAKKNTISSSLLNRDVYCVCFPERDGLDSLQDEFAEARKKYLTGGRKTVKTGKSEVVKGFDGRLQGKLSRRSLYWKKTTGKAAGKITLEEAFQTKGGPALVKRDFRNVIVSRVFFDREQRWIRSEYYEPWDPVNARITFRPSETSDIIERFDREPDGNTSRTTDLYPIPYLAGTAEQSILNARFGEPRLVVSTAEGQFCYCTRREAAARRRALNEIKDGTIVLMPAWEVKDGSLNKEAPEEEQSLSFSSLEEHAHIEAPEASEAPAAELPPQPEPEAPAPEAAETVREPAVEETPLKPETAEAVQEPAAEKAPAEPEDEETSPVPESAEAVQGPAAGEAPEEFKAGEAVQESSASEPETTEEAPETAIPEDKPTPEASAPREEREPAEAADFPTDVPEAVVIREGKLPEHGRTQQESGLTSYEGEYQDGKREGFGSYYYKDGSLCYAGFWKNDRKDGLGVSFRDTDHALHIAKWENGRPGGFVSLFDTEGNLRYGGRIVEGKKQGAGVSFDQTDGTVFVGKWVDGQPTGVGSSFDREGNLLYYGGWKDGKRSGHGTEFDKNGGIVFDGEWKDGKYHNGILYQKQAPEAPSADEGPHWEL